MRSRDVSTRCRWIVRAAVFVALASQAIRVPCVAAAEDDAAVAAARESVEKLRRDMELAYLDVQRDHERVRAEDWPRTPFGNDFASALGDFVRDARAQPESRTAAQDRDDATACVLALGERRIDPPLTRTTLAVVLAETARSVRTDRAILPRDAFVAAARAVFDEAKPEDAWDARFLELPVVLAFKAAQAKLGEAREKPAPGTWGDKSATPPGEKPAEKPAEKTATPAEAPILCDRTRVWLGPWTGWTSDVAEKQNRRQQRTVKTVWIDRYETTCAQYLAFLESLGVSGRRVMLPQGWTMDDQGAVVAPAGKERHPVTGVTWRQAQAFAESQGKRLPTCDEWERAAAGGEKESRAFPWGASEEGRRWAHLGVEPKGTFPVDEFKDDATPEGVAGMAGNAAELVASHPDRTDVPKTGPEKGRQVLVCGGSFTSRVSECATSWRWVADADGASPSVGFRCVMDDAEYRKRHK